MLKKIALMLCACLLAGLLPAALAEEIESAQVEAAVEAEEFELTGEAEAAEADIAAAEWNEEAPEDPVLVPKKASEFVIEDHGEYQELMEYNGKGGDVVLPEGLTEIYAHGLFEDNLTSVTFPTTMNTIMDSVFEGQTHLTKVVFQSDVFLGEYVFAWCSKLETVVLPKGFTRIGYGCFEGCTNLKHIDFPSTLKSIHTFAFSGSGLTELVLPEGFETFGEQSFEGCRSLKHAVLPASMTDVPGETFSNCTSLKDVTFLGADTYLSDGVFEVYDEAADKYVPSCADGLVIRGWPGSTAEAYAKKYNYTFEPLVKVEKITLNKAGTQPLVLGKTLKLTVAISPESANVDTEVTWTSSDEKVATVSAKGSGSLVSKGGAKAAATAVVTPVGKGTAKITCTVGDISKSVKVKVSAPKPTKVTLYKSGKKLKNKQTVTLKKGKTLKLKVKLSPKYAESKLTWKSSNKKVATVKNGKVKAVGKGKATITVTAKTGKKSAKVIVKVE